MKNGGIYKIINKINGHYYVGRSQNLIKRFNRHRVMLRNKKHDNIHLQRAWDKYGELNFEFKIVEHIVADVNLLIKTEEKYISKFIEDRKNGIDNCYNMSLKAYGGHSFPGNQFRKGIPHTSDVKDKISKSLLGNKNNQNNIGKPISEEHRKKIIDGSLKGKDNPSYNHTIYKFYNINTKESFVGTLYELVKKENFSNNSTLHKVIKGVRNHYKGWIYIP